MTKPDSLDALMREVLAARGIAAVPESTAMPGNGAMPGDVGRDNFGGALSAPEAAEAYQIAVPPHMTRDAAIEAKARQWFHRAGLPQGVVSGIVQAYCRQLCAEEASPDMRGSKVQADLAQEWGPDYPRKVAAAQALIEKCGGAQELTEILNATGLGDDAWLIRSLAALGEIDPNAGGQQ
nr:hypothetical protein [uncultured Dongia sp.]